MGGHSVEPWATGSVPMKESQEWGKYSSSLSYAGATHRMITWAEGSVRLHSGKPGHSVFVWTAAITGMLALYAVATAWYLFLALNVVLALASFAVSLFIWPLLALSVGWLMFSLAPFGFRSHRRAQRRQTALMAEQLRAMEAIQTNTAPEQRPRNE